MDFYTLFEVQRLVCRTATGGELVEPSLGFAIVTVFLCKVLPTRALMLAVGAAIVVLQIRTLYQALG